MNLDRIFEIVDNPEIIPGIYNYCDRWCEKCKLKMNCLTYSLNNANEEIKENDISKAFSNLKELFIAFAKEQKIEIKDNIEEAEKINDLSTNHEISLSADDYINKVDNWFEKQHNFLLDKEKSINSVISLEIDKKNNEKIFKEISDSFDIIRWYQYQIAVKIVRALSYQSDEDDDSIQNDQNGSAKVALLGIEKSINAWKTIIEIFPDKIDCTIDILAHLEKLNKNIINNFPKAMLFIRPGFDE